MLNPGGAEFSTFSRGGGAEGAESQGCLRIKNYQGAQLKWPGHLRVLLEPRDLQDFDILAVKYKRAKDRFYKSKSEAQKGDMQKALDAGIEFMRSKGIDVHQCLASHRRASSSISSADARRRQMKTKANEMLELCDAQEVDLADASSALNGHVSGRGSVLVLCLF